jgi:hypothetical protein
MFVHHDEGMNISHGGVEIGNSFEKLLHRFEVRSDQLESKISDIHAALFTRTDALLTEITQLKNIIAGGEVLVFNPKKNQISIHNGNPAAGDASNIKSAYVTDSEPNRNSDPDHGRRKHTSSTSAQKLDSNQGYKMSSDIVFAHPDSAAVEVETVHADIKNDGVGITDIETSGPAEPRIRKAPTVRKDNANMEWLDVDDEDDASDGDDKDQADGAVVSSLNRIRRRIMCRGRCSLTALTDYLFWSTQASAALALAFLALPDPCRRQPPMLPTQRPCASDEDRAFVAAHDADAAAAAAFKPVRLRQSVGEATTQGSSVHAIHPASPFMAGTPKSRPCHVPVTSHL